MRQTPRYSVAAVSMARFTAPPAQTCYMNVACWADANLERPSSPGVTGFQPSILFIPLALYGKEEIKAKQVLASCYRSSLEIAARHNLRSLAFPSISTGIYGYPIELAAPTAIDTVCNILSEAPDLEEILFCCFSDADLEVYQNALARVAA